METKMYSHKNLDRTALEHLYMHRSNQRLKHTVMYGYYVSSACTGYRWKGDRMKLYFETMVYRFKTDAQTLKRLIFAPVRAFQYNSYQECMNDHSRIVNRIFTKRFIKGAKEACEEEMSGSGVF